MPNRLAAEPSPYLRQHADNPVDWWPWSDDAFTEAARRDVPVFLSVGYATCHWCHVMAHESFEDAAVAAHLNAAFVCVKLDREERPDVDALYMAVCQMTTGHGGWPLTVLLTPERKPFYVATYLPPRTRHGRAGVVELAAAISGAWRDRRKEVEAAAADLTRMARARFAPQPVRGPALGAHTLDAAFEELRARFDPEHGGFGTAPKFPTPHVGRFLLRYHRRTGNPEALAMVVKTLEGMQQGGIHDPLGGGFHRYATDREWRLPHFEKMLYDQAGLLDLYAEAAAVTGRPDFAEIARGVFTYLTRDLRHPDGAFFSAEDADSKGPDGHLHEGAFYVWTEAELSEILGEADAAVFARAYGFEPGGNFLDEATRETTGENILHLTAPVRDLAPAGEDPDAFAGRIATMRARLFVARTRRPRPLLDDKVLADWNGLAIAALARAQRLTFSPFAVGGLHSQNGSAPVMTEEDYFAALDRIPDFAGAAAEATRFVLDRMLQADGRLFHRQRDGHVGLDATADDYAFVVRGLLEQLEHDNATGLEPQTLRDAAALTERLIEDHWDEVRGLFTTARRGTKDLLAQPAERYDGATPSANAVACRNLLDLARLTGRDDFAAMANRMLAAAADEVAAHPSGYAAWLLAIDEVVHGTREIVIVHDGTAGETGAAFDLRNAAWAAGTVDDLVLVLGPDDRAALADVAPTLASYAPPGPGAWAFVCQNFACAAPVQSPEALRAALLR